VDVLIRPRKPTTPKPSATKGASIQQAPKPDLR
jgi:hypothetical protein